MKIGLFGPGADAIAAAMKIPGFQLAGVSSDVPWGKASTELVKVVYDPAVIALIATDRASAHLAEQIAVKSFVPVLALSSDHTLTSTNIPWIFRFGSRATLDQVVACLSDAVRRAGPNRGRIRDVLASGKPLAGAFAFSSNGELK
jgi:hypothetical protein